MTGEARVPVATYRLQFHQGFRFQDAFGLAPYLNRLGISDIYASPILKARKGSTHGYDVTDPTSLNPELGTDANFNALSEELGKQGMGWLLDIVPNHMAASPENLWWQDVTENGKDSRYADFFDTGWLDFGKQNGEVPAYRRFFDIGDLVGIRVEDPEVFEATHNLIIRLIAEGRISGLRIDHIDGLYNPQEYLLRLQQYISSQTHKERPFFITVEKILSGDEELAKNWPVSGTTGYDYSNMLNTFFMDREGIKDLNNIYSQFIDSLKSFREIVYEKKKQVMLELFHGEIDALGQWLAHLSGEMTSQEESQALVELTACLPVYRTYIQTRNISPQDRKYLENAFREARHHAAMLKDALDFLEQVLTLNLPVEFSPEEERQRIDFVARWQQLTGAIMAKGYEDTALYNYHRLTSLNEVGGNPDTTGLTTEDFHKWNLNRMRNWPRTLNTTSTHDTKRSEDVRARISVISEITDEWREHLMRWQKFNEIKKRKLGRLPVPEPNTEMLLYQTMVGAWPLSSDEVPEFKERLKAYMIKAAREAKAITSWIEINREYEDSLLHFIDTILRDSAENEFLIDFLKFQEKIAYYGALNSISQLMLKIASPGVPDFYQGLELWDFSLVDPDNRRLIDYEKRQRLLDSLIQKEANEGHQHITEMLASWKDGRIKLYITYKALNVRRTHHELFQNGDYIPLNVEGIRKECVCAFVRRYGEKWILVAVPRFFTRLTAVNTPRFGKQVWGDDRILLSQDAPRNWVNIFTGETFSIGESTTLAGLFHDFPIVMLTNL